MNAFDYIFILLNTWLVSALITEGIEAKYTTRFLSVVILIFIFVRAGIDIWSGT